MNSRDSEICMLYQEGFNYHFIADKFSIGPHTIQKTLLRNGIEPRANRRRSVLSKENRLEAVKLYRQGNSLGQISKLFSCSTSTIKHSLSEAGVDSRKEWTTKFKTQTSRDQLKAEFLARNSLSGLAKKNGCSRDAIFNGLLKAGLTEEQILSGLSFVYESQGKHFLKSEHELECAKLLDEHGLKWRYEPETLRIEGFSYLPDFVVYDSKIPRYVIDVKGNHGGSFSPNKGDTATKRLNRIIEIVGTVYPGSEFVVTNPTNVKLVIESISRRI